MKVQLLHFGGCPNLESARAVLRIALAKAGVTAHVEEIDTADAATPANLRGWGSPTILIDEVDVAGEAPTGGAACRVYDHGGRMAGAPPVAMVRAAIEAARAAAGSR